MRRYFSRDSFWFRGMVIKVNMQDDMAYWIKRKGSSYEKEVIEMMETKLQVGDTFIDAGGYIGHHTLAASQVVGPTGKVIVFEPSPSSCEILEYNVKKNHLLNVTISDLALSDHTGQEEFYWSERRQMYRKIDEFNEHKQVKIPCITLSNYLKDLHVDFIKIDAEGSELDILKGAESILKNQHPFLICEVWKKSPKSFKPYLLDLGYSFTPIDYKEGEESYNIFAWKNIA